MKTLGWIIVALIMQRNVLSKDPQDEQDVLDHSNEEDHEHVNEWVVHIPKGKLNIRQ